MLTGVANILYRHYNGGEEVAECIIMVEKRWRLALYGGEENILYQHYNGGKEVETPSLNFILAKDLSACLPNSTPAPAHIYDGGVVLL